MLGVSSFWYAELIKRYFGEQCALLLSNLENRGKDLKMQTASKLKFPSVLSFFFENQLYLLNF